VAFQSPFENLFGLIDLENPTKCILSKLNLIDFIEKPCAEDAETILVSLCLLGLTTNKFNHDHRKIWGDFLKIADNNPKNIEELFKIANTVIVAMGSKNKDNYDTCSILPLSEKQIQLQYTKNIGGSYPKVFNLSVFEPVITHSPTTNGLLFYFSCKSTVLSTLILDKKLDYLAARNLSFFANSGQKRNKSISSEEKQQEPIDLISMYS